MLKLPEVRRPDEIERTNDLNDCLFHRMVHHPTSKCLVLKDKIQALIDIGDLLLKWEQKKVIVNMLTLIVKDEQWESNQPKLKGKSFNVISLAQDKDALTIASLSNSKEEKCALAAQPTTSQPVGTRSRKKYLRQYDKTPDETQQSTMSDNVAPLPASAPAPLLDKEKQKEAWCDKALKKNPYQGLNTPFRLTYWHNWPIFQLVLLYTNYSASRGKQERRSGMFLLMHSLF